MNAQQNVIISRGRIIISLSAFGKTIVTVNGAQHPMPYGTSIQPVSDYAKSRSAKTAYDAATRAGATHIMGGVIGLQPGEADKIEAARAAHPVLAAQKAAFDADCARLSAAERKLNREQAWQRDSSLGFAEGAETASRADNTPQYKGDIR